MQVHGALNHLIQSDSFAFRPSLPGAQQQLAQDRAGPLGFLINLARFFGAASEIFPDEEALRVAQNAGQRIAQFMRDAGDHLSERRKFFRLQEFGLKNALGGKVAVNLDTSEAAACAVQNRTYGALQHARHGPRQLQLLAAAAFGAASQFAPAFGKLFRLRGALREVANQAIQRGACAASSGDNPAICAKRVFMARIAVVRAEQQNSFFDPLKHVVQFRLGAAALLDGFVARRRS